MATADRLYDQATDIVEAIMVNVPSRTAQMRLVGVMSQLYAGHFALAAGQLKNLEKAYRIIERARGRALADILRVVPSDNPLPADDDRLSAISALQLRLMRARTAAERQRLLDDLFEVEQRVSVTLNSGVGTAAARYGAPARRESERCSARWRQGKFCWNSCCLNRVRTAWQLRRKAFSWCALPGKTHLENLSQRAREDLQAGRASTGAASRELYDVMLAPLRAAMARGTPPVCCARRTTPLAAV